MNVYKLEHEYSRSHKFYGVRTTLTFHELNVLCAYLQLLHFELPRIDGAEDTIAEDNGEKLLKTIFNAESVYEEEKYSQTLDFHDNWNELNVGMRSVDIAKESSSWKTLTNGSAMLKVIFIGSITLLKGTQ
ncbi:hypothetical protein ABKW01_02650 [Enterobacter hormaechei]